MAYTAKNAIETLLGYLKVNKNDVTVIPNTKERGIIYKNIVIFIYPISCKQGGKQDFFDTRDSGANQRKEAWNYAKINRLKYFCLGVNDVQDRFKNLILSLEATEEYISSISYRKIGGTQANIPNGFTEGVINFKREKTPNGFWISVINKDEIQTYLKYHDNIPYCTESILDLANNRVLEESYIDEDLVGGDLKGNNIIIYGVPGCGKSHYIKKKYNINSNNCERVVFHPDYSYSDFIGQILPKTKEGSKKDIKDIYDSSEDIYYSSKNKIPYIEYEFIPGPFTRILKSCIDNIDEMHYLVIEEINRGNAAAVFGDIFQLLDRNEEGISEYGINNEEIAKVVYGDESKKVEIQNNLTILATMNTADQNVFTLDTAFKRRWQMKSIRNNFKLLYIDSDNDDEEVIKEKNEFNKQLNYTLCDSEITWKEFAETINKKIIEENELTLGSEDKRLGHFFIKHSEMDDVEKFSEKVIMYLWNDVFKFDKSKIYCTKIYNTLEEVLDAFSDKEIRFKVFNLSFNNKENNITYNSGDNENE